MNTLTIDTGEQTFSLNGKVDITFNPSDANFIRTLYDAFSALGKRQEDYSKRREAIKDDDITEMLNFLDSENKEMRSIIDNVFDVPVCDAVFGSKNVYALTTDGIPLWAGLLFAILDECDTSVAQLNTKGTKTAQKYLKKYRK